MSYITSIMIGTYTPVDFRLPRPAGAGLAMTLSLAFSFKLWLSVFSANVHSDILELYEVTVAHPEFWERMKDEG